MGQLILIKASTDSHMVSDIIYSLMQTVWEEPFGTFWLTAMVDSPGDTWLNIFSFLSCRASVGKNPCLTVFGKMEYVSGIYCIRYFYENLISHNVLSPWEVGCAHITHCPNTCLLMLFSIYFSLLHVSTGMYMQTYSC